MIVYGSRSEWPEQDSRVMHRFWLVHTNFAEEFEFLALDWSKFKFHQSNSNCYANFGSKFAQLKSVHCSCSGYTGQDIKMEFCLWWFHESY